MTILLTPFMSCSAKLPIYGFFVNAFFRDYAWLVMTGLYLLGIAIGVLVALFYKKTIFKGEAVPFVMELPNYRLPGARNVLMLLWDKAKDFLQRAFTIIFVTTIIIWFLQNFNIHFTMVSDSQDSMLAAIAGFLEPVFAPIGLGDWKLVTSLITGVMAKESVISTLGILYGETVAISTAAAASMLVFSLLYSPCVAAIASVKRELGGKWAVGVVVWQTAVAWVASLITFSLCGLWM